MSLTHPTTITFIVYIAAMIGIGFAGRVLTIALSGYEATMLQPMAVEVVLIALFAAGRNLLPKS